MLVAHKSGAALYKEKKVGLGEIANPARCRREPRNVRRISFAGVEGTAAVHARPVEHALRAEDPHAVLVIATGLHTASNVGHALRTVAGKRAVQIRREIFVRPSVADIAADVAAGPIVHGRRRRSLRRPVDRKGNGRDRNATEQKFFHRGPRPASPGGRKQPADSPNADPILSVNGLKSVTISTHTLGVRCPRKPKTPR